VPAKRSQLVLLRLAVADEQYEFERLGEAEVPELGGG
jgi:hypothetical protein